ncbi:hypothetical protein FGG78_29875, partial [Thioclava sp. BHET1]
MTQRAKPSGIGADLPEAGQARPIGVLPLLGLALITGSVAGVGAVIFRALIGIIHNLLFLG